MLLEADLNIQPNTILDEKLILIFLCSHVVIEVLQFSAIKI